MSVRLKDIAAHLGVSVSTVSLALREAPQIAEETRLRVRDAALRLGYVQRPRQSVRAEIGQVAFITHCEPDNVFYAAVLSGAEQACRQRQIALRYSRLDEVSTSALAHYREADGLLLVGTIDESIVQRIRDVGRPMVLVDNNLPHLGLDRVLIENVASLYRTVARLASWGHRRIAFLSGPQSAPSFRERSLGYRLATADLGLEPIELACRRIAHEEIGAAIRAQLGPNNTPQFTALIACSDLAAIMALHALQDCGVQVPDDVSLVGFDDIDMAQVMRPTLTTCHVYRELLGALAVRRLIERIDDPNGPALALLIDTTFIERASARPLQERAILARSLL